MLGAVVHTQNLNYLEGQREKYWEFKVSLGNMG